MKEQIRTGKYNSQTEKLFKPIQKIVDSYSMPITSRQVFYRLVSLGIVENTKNGYQAICRMCSKMRYTGNLDWEKIVDDTRGAYKTQEWESMENALQAQIERFRFDRWVGSPYYLEIHVEKRGMINTLYPTANKYDVHIVSAGGWDSTSNVWSTVKRLKQKQNKEIIIFYFGDFDPSGDQMPATAERKLKEFGLDIKFERVLLELEHVQLYDLPVSYKVLAKKSTGEIYDKLSADPRALGFIKKYGRLMQVEIDSLEPNVLVEYVEDSILEYLDMDQYQGILEQEEEEKQKWLGRL